MGIQERKKREKERRRQQIIIAAKKVFSSKGFNKTTMEDIAKKAELSPGTLYLYFRNKDELFTSLSMRILQYLLIRINDIDLKAELTSKQLMKALKDAFLDVYKFDPLILVNMFHLQSSETLSHLSPELLSDIHELSNNALNSIARIFDKGIQNGEFIDRAPLTMAHIIWGMFSGIVLWEENKKTTQKKGEHLKQILETAFLIFSRGIEKKPQI
ncbi:MAG: TetR family transcriptional regulator [Desulfobacteraceae bacterium 4572_123]|nr:MAG: TetR family transcriptional regulator [Desulfobacteraceae bacterium 4572_123]